MGVVMSAGFGLWVGMTVAAGFGPAMSPPATPAAVGGPATPAQSMSSAPASAGERPASAEHAQPAVAAPAAEVAAKGPAAAKRERVHVSFRVGTTEYDGVRVSGSLPARIEGIGLEYLRGEGMVTMVRGDYTAEVVVAPLGAEGDGYITSFVVFRGEEELDGSRHRVKCELCLEDELLTQVRGELGGVVKAIQDDRSPPVVEPEPVAPKPVEVVTPAPVYVPPPPVEEPPRRGLSRLGGIGIGTVVVGAVALGAGTALLITDEEGGRDLRRPIFALVGVGGVAMISGIGLLVVDRELRQPQSKVVPTASRSGAGLAWVGRF